MSVADGVTSGSGANVCGSVADGASLSKLSRNQLMTLFTTVCVEDIFN